MKINEVIVNQEEQELLEYKRGAKITGSAYIQRLGTPGHYTYVYPSKKFTRFGRKFSRIYSRYIRRHKKLFSKMGMRYEASSTYVKPRTWEIQILTMKTKYKGIVDVKLDLGRGKVISYRSRTHINGNATKLAQAKRKGVLRYR